jgi:hypothetical protein
MATQCILPKHTTNLHNFLTERYTFGMAAFPALDTDQICMSILKGLVN